jgi:hypothetical protein
MKTVILYHRITRAEKFEETVQNLIKLVYEAQQFNSEKKRVLYLDITGHRNELGGYDTDTFELMSEFIPKYLLMWLSAVHMPLGILHNDYQQNDVPEGVEIT